MKKNTPYIPALIISLLVSMIIMSGCGDFSGTEGDPSKASLAVVYTMDDKDKTVIQWLDDEANVTGTSKYPYAGTVTSFENADHQDGKLYLVPTGVSNKKDETDVIIADSETGSCEAVTLETANHVAGDTDGKSWIISGNLNGEGYIDLIDLKTKKIKTYKDSRLWDLGIMQVALVNGKIFGAGGDTEHNYICKIDMDKKTTEIIYECPDDPQEHSPSYLERHDNDLVFISDSKMIRYDTDTGKDTSVELSRDDADIINVRGDLAWICYTDQQADVYDSLIETRDYKTGKVISQISCDFPVIQLEPGDGSVYAAGYDKISKFTFKDGKLTFDRDIPYAEEYADYTIGGIYSLNK